MIQKSRNLQTLCNISSEEKANFAQSEATAAQNPAETAKLTFNIIGSLTYRYLKKL